MENIFISNYLLFYMNCFWQEELQVILQCVALPIYYNWYLIEEFIWVTSKLFKHQRKYPFIYPLKHQRTQIFFFH